MQVTKKLNMVSIFKCLDRMFDFVAELPSGAPLASWEIKGNP